MSKKYVDENGLAQIATIVKGKLSQKVDKVTGKVLSTNDYTTAEKTKLAGIANNANNYTLPKASASVLGGIKVGKNLSIDSDGVLSATDTNTTYSVATISKDGLMSSYDKAKIDGVETGATKNVASSTTPKANGTASVGTESSFSRGDHVHPLQTTVSGNAGTATKLQTARTIALSGAVTGSTTFDGSGNKTISTTLAGFDASKITSGTIDIARIPAAAIETVVVVDNDTARFALTVTEVQNGDCVKVTGTGKMYMVKDQTKLTSEAGYEEFTVGKAAIAASCTGNSATATKATQDSAGQQINTTYIKGLSVSGRTITYTKGNGATGTITTQDTNTTYSVATQSANGLMSAADKTKLDNMAGGNTTHGYTTIKSGQTLTNGYAVTLPVSYVVGSHQLELYANGERLILKDSSTSDGHYQESGSAGATSSKITFYRTSADGNVTLTSDLVIYAVVKA